MVYLSVCLTLCFFVNVLTVSYVYKTLKMPANCCIYKLMFYIYLIKYLFNISEYEAMIIKLLIYHINIDVCMHMYVYIYIYIYVYICMYVYTCVCVCVCVCVYINKQKCR